MLQSKPHFVVIRGATITEVAHAGDERVQRKALGSCQHVCVGIRDDMVRRAALIPHRSDQLMTEIVLGIQ